MTPSDNRWYSGLALPVPFAAEMPVKHGFHQDGPPDGLEPRLSLGNKKGEDNMKKWMLAVLVAALLVLSGVSQGCNRSGKWSVTTAADGQGTITPAGITMWEDGATVTLTATPVAGWKFDSWSGDYSGTANPFMFDIERNMTFVARFIADTQTQNLVNGPIAMAPAQPDIYGHNAYGIQFHVGAATMHGVTISGTFAVTSTSPGDKVEVLILDWDNYNALLVGGSWTAVYSSGQVTTGTLNVPVTTANPGGTTFYLAFVGISPEGPSVEVQANVDLKWTG
jgi:hypothetical protein